MYMQYNIYLDILYDIYKCNQSFQLEVKHEKQDSYNNIQQY